MCIEHFIQALLVAGVSLEVLREVLAPGQLKESLEFYLIVIWPELQRDQLFRGNTQINLG